MPASSVSLHTLASYASQSSTVQVIVIKKAVEIPKIKVEKKKVEKEEKEYKLKSSYGD